MAIIYVLYCKTPLIRPWFLSDDTCTHPRTHSHSHGFWLVTQIYRRIYGSNSVTQNGQMMLNNKSISICSKINSIQTLFAVCTLDVEFGVWMGFECRWCRRRHRCRSRHVETIILTSTTTLTTSHYALKHSLNCCRRFYCFFFYLRPFLSFKYVFSIGTVLASECSSDKCWSRP